MPKALRLGKAVNYTHAGTVEFLMDVLKLGRSTLSKLIRVFRLEHTVTEQVTGIDIVKAQDSCVGTCAHRQSRKWRAGAGQYPSERSLTTVPVNN